MKNKHFDLIVAWANGEKIEYLSTVSNTWVPAPTPNWDEDSEWRIKPTTKPDYVKFYNRHGCTEGDETLADFFLWHQLFIKVTFSGETDDIIAFERYKSKPASLKPLSK